MNSPHLFSFGGGVQSTAALVLAATGRIDYRSFVFANVGDDSENPGTLAYVRDVAIPYAESSGLELTTLQRKRRDGTIETLLERVERSKRSIPIPVRMSNGAPGNRQCTFDFKIRPIAQELKRRGATKDNPWTVGLGISVDEIHRARTNSGIAWELLAYPLLDLKLNRHDCLALIRDAGLPQPPKSSCWFCPFHDTRTWQEMRANQPGLFEKSAALEESINEKRGRLGRDRVFFSGRCKPLREAIKETGQIEMEGCDSGYCFT